MEQKTRISVVRHPEAMVHHRRTSPAGTLIPVGPVTSADAARTASERERIGDPGRAGIVGFAQAHPLVGVVGVLLALTLGFFSPVLGGRHFSTIPAHSEVVYPWAAASPSGQTSYPYPQSDQADLSHPWNTFLAAAVKGGSFPFWDPHSYGGGYPFYANGSSATLYPPRLVTVLLFDPVRAHDIFGMLHVFLSGLFMYALMREFRVGRAGSVLAAVSWMFAGFNMAWLHLEVVTPMSVFLPLDLLCVHRAARSGSRAATVVAGLVLGATLMSGHVILMGLVYVVAMAYAGALAVAGAYRGRRAGTWRQGLPHLVRLGLVVAISLGFAMVVLLPTAHALGGSQRDPFTYDTLLRSYLAPARTLLYGFVPPPLPVTEDRMHEMAFAGTATGLLAMGGLLVRRRGSWLGRVMLVAAFAIALGTPATWLAYRAIPGFDVFRPYSRLLVFSTFAVALLGGIGLDALWRRSGTPTDGGRGGDRFLPRRRLVTRRRVAVLSVVVIGGSALQLAWYGRAVNPPPGPRGGDAYFPRTPLIRALDREILQPGAWPGRVLPTRVFEPGAGPGPPILFAAEGLQFGFDSAGGYDSAVPRRVAAMTRVLQGEDPEAVLRSGLTSYFAPVFDSPSVRFDLAARMGITVLATNPGSVLETAATPGGALPVAEVAYEGTDGRLLRISGSSAAPYLVFADVVVGSADDALRRFVDPGFDFRHAVVVEAEELRRGGVGALDGETGTGRVLSARRGINSATVTLTASSPGWLVFHDSWAAGWSATIDGERAAVVEANYAKRAVRVPAGRSVVRLRYRPPGLAAGGVVTLLTLLSCAAAVALPRRRRPPGERDGPTTTSSHPRARR